MAPKKKSKPEHPTDQGESPPGLKLRNTLRGHTDWIGGIAWSPDGRVLASPSGDRTIRLWDAATGALVRKLEGHSERVFSVAWSPDGRTLASGSNDSTIRLWDAATGTVVRKLEEHSRSVYGVAWSPDGRTLASASGDKTVRLWDGATGAVIRTLEGHSGHVNSVAWSPDRQTLASASDDNTIRLWEGQSGREIKIVESHSQRVCDISFSSDGKILSSVSWDDTVKLWDCDSWRIIASVKAEHVSGSNWQSVGFHPHSQMLATLGEEDKVIRAWDLDLPALLGAAPPVVSVHSTTAKIVLVGDSRVGKTGLGWRLAHGDFKEHPSTHGQQFWLLDSLRARRADGTECEAVLWDLAGQPDYRLRHALFLDDAELALVLFNPITPASKFLTQEPPHTGQKGVGSSSGRARGDEASAP
jgi:uncharacterized protein with WD repeat